MPRGWTTASNRVLAISLSKEEPTYLPTAVSDENNPTLEDPTTRGRHITHNPTLLPSAVPEAPLPGQSNPSPDAVRRAGARRFRAGPEEAQATSPTRVVTHAPRACVPASRRWCVRVCVCLGAQAPRARPVHAHIPACHGGKTHGRRPV